MALILVVEQEARYVERIRDALTSEGWQVRVAGGHEQALEAADREPPQLVLVSRQADGAESLLQTFGRRTGGPGTVALLPESATDLKDPLADEAVAKPFTDQDLRLAVRRGLRPTPADSATVPSSADPSATPPSATTPSEMPDDPPAETEERQLTADDIFGDLVAEVESEIRQTSEPAEPPAPEPPRQRPAAKPRPAPKPAAQASDDTSDDEMELEKTLSGLRRDLALSGKSVKESPTKPTLDLESPSPTATRPKRSRPPTSDDLGVDALLSETLSGLDLPKTKKKDKKTLGKTDLGTVDEIHDETAPGTDGEAAASAPPDVPAAATGGAETRKLDWDRLREAARAEESEKEAAPEQAAAEHDTAPEPPKDPREISFADLSAPSLHEIAEPVPPSLAGGGDDEEEIDLELEVDLSDDLESDLGSDLEASLGGLEAAREEEPPFGEAAAGDDTASHPADQKAYGEDRQDDEVPVGGSSLGDWLESGGDSMFVPSRETLREMEDETESPVSASGGTGAPVAPEAPAKPVPEVAASESREGGQRFGQYTLLDRIAVGGMAEVWKARMSGVEGFQKTVAIKKILPHLTDNADFVNMFVDEAKLAAQLSHPNIIHIYDLGKIGDHFYIAMEYVEGKNLRALLNESRRKALPLPRPLALLIAARLASALDHAHRKKDFDDRELGLVHRDVSPQNVLISEEGDIKLCDFGIVKAVSKASQTQMGALKGKLQYMSPEQAWGKDVDARSDIFSLGAILFEMLTGRRLFTGDSELSVLEAVRQCQVIAPRDLVPGIPETVEAATLKALEMDPERRYQSAGQLQQKLEDILYSDKPAPGPADLAEFLERLAAAEEVDETERRDDGERDRAAAPSPATGSQTTSQATGTAGAPTSATGTTATGTTTTGTTATGTATTGTTATGTTTTGTGSSVRATAEAAPTGSGPMERAGGAPQQLLRATEEMEAGEYADYDLEELAEGGGRGRIWLWIVLALVLVAGAAAAYYFYVLRPRGELPNAGAPAEAPATEPVPMPPSPLDQELEGEDEYDDYDDAPADDQAPAESGTLDPTPSTGSTPSVAATHPISEPVARAAAARPPPERQPTSPQTASRPSPERRTVRSQDAPSPSPASTSPPSSPEDISKQEEVAASGAAAAADQPRSVKLRPRAGRDPDAENVASPVSPRALEGQRRDPPAAPAAAEGEEEESTDEESESEPAPREPTRWLRPPPDSKPGVGIDNAEGDEGEGDADEEAQPEPAPQPPPDPKVRTGDLVGPGPGVAPPVLVRFDKPSYPPIARRMKVQGEVVLSLLVDENGRVVETRLIQGVRGGAGLNEAATQAARRAKYRPATKNGVRVKMWTTLKIPFRL